MQPRLAGIAWTTWWYLNSIVLIRRYAIYHWKFTEWSSIESSLLPIHLHSHWVWESLHQLPHSESLERSLQPLLVAFFFLRGLPSLAMQSDVTKQVAWKAPFPCLALLPMPLTNVPSTRHAGSHHPNCSSHRSQVQWKKRSEKNNFWRNYEKGPIENVKLLNLAQNSFGIQMLGTHRHKGGTGARGVGG